MRVTVRLWTLMNAFAKLYSVRQSDSRRDRQWRRIPICCTLVPGLCIARGTCRDGLQYYLKGSKYAPPSDEFALSIWHHLACFEQLRHLSNIEWRVFKVNSRADPSIGAMDFIDVEFRWMIRLF